MAILSISAVLVGRLLSSLRLTTSWGEYDDVVSSSLRPTLTLVRHLMLTVPPGNVQVTCRPHRVSPTVAKQVALSLTNLYREASLAQYPTLTFLSPLVVVPKKSGRVGITVNHRKFNNLCPLSQFPIPRVDDALDKLFKGIYYFNLPTTVHCCDTTRLTEFVTSPGSFE